MLFYLLRITDAYVTGLSYGIVSLSSAVSRDWQKDKNELLEDFITFAVLQLHDVVWEN
jgi:hypothetical protein